MGTPGRGPSRERHRRAVRVVPFTSRFAPQAMVCSVDHLASAAGVEAMRRGGTAADAAVAASAVLAVTTQQMCGMGGDLFAIVHQEGGPPAALNSSGRAGAGADPNRLRGEGHRFLPARGDIRSVTVPGCVDGWVSLHARFGRLPLAEVLEAARGYAEGGFPAAPTLAASARSVAVLPGGEDFAGATAPGAMVRRPGVARSLAAIAREGRDAFYLGEFGDGLVQLGRGEYERSDLERSSADWVEPLGADALGARLWTIPPNSQGYLTLAGTLIAEGLPLPLDPDEALWAHLTVEAARQAAKDRDDVLHEHADGDALVAPDRIESLRREIALDRSVELEREGYAKGGTIYLCAVDSERTAVSLIQSNAGGFGAGIAEPSTGIFLQNRGVGFSLEEGHPAEYQPGRRPPHTLSPVLVTDTDGRLRMVLGTMGGDSQPQVLLQLLCRLLLSGEDAGDAIAAGRWVVSNARNPGGFWTWDRDGEIEVLLEENTPTPWAPGLAARGHRVARRPVGHGFGHAHVIVSHGDHLEGASDPRSLAGSASGY